jgi:hypothetical protein
MDLATFCRFGTVSGVDSAQTFWFDEILVNSVSSFFREELKENTDSLFAVSPPPRDQKKVCRRREHLPITSITL